MPMSGPGTTRMAAAVQQKPSFEADRRAASGRPRLDNARLRPPATIASKMARTIDANINLLFPSSLYWRDVTFRERLIGTLRVLQPVLDEPGVLVVGSEVPNLLQPDAAATLVVSQDVDVAVPVDHLETIKRRLREVEGLVPSAEEPSVYVPASPELIEAKFLGHDRRIREPGETYVFEDPELPLMVFGPLGLLRPGPVLEVSGLRIPLPRAADLMVEKLLTDRTGEKGARDLLVVAGMLAVATDGDLAELVEIARGLSREAQHAIYSSLTLLSLMEGRPGMPDPTAFRHQVAQLLRRLEERHG
jgi:hypothetical protein